MSRIKRGISHLKRRKNLFKKAKGFKWGRKNTIKAAKTAVTKAGAHAYRHRRTKKREAKKLWQIKINAACRQRGLNYSQFINKLKKAKVELDRKVLADLAENNSKTFSKIFKEIR